MHDGQRDELDGELEPWGGPGAEDGELEPWGRPGAEDGERDETGMPIRGHHYGEPAPDLRRIPRERWRSALAPLSGRARRVAAATVSGPDDVLDVMQLIGELMLEDPLAPRERPVPVPRTPRAGPPPARGASRQVSFRLGAHEHAQLVRAAGLFALRPAVLARLLTVRGVERALYEERRRAA